MARSYVAACCREFVPDKLYGFLFFIGVYDDMSSYIDDKGLLHVKQRSSSAINVFW